MLKKMTKKQKKQFYKIVAAFVLLIVGVILPIPELYKLIFFIPGYLIVGYDVLAKAGKNITKGQVFDENFLMAIATIGICAAGVYRRNSCYAVLSGRRAVPVIRCKSVQKISCIINGYQT